MVVPADVVAALGARKRPPVRVTIGPHTFRSTVAAYGDDFYLPLNAANRKAAGVVAGDDVVVGVELDEEPSVVEVPSDLADALAGDPEAAAAFAALSYSHQREFVEWINEAKRPATRPAGSPARWRGRPDGWQAGGTGRIPPDGDSRRGRGRIAPRLR